MKIGKTMEAREKPSCGVLLAWALQLGGSLLCIDDPWNVWDLKVSVLFK